MHTGCTDGPAYFSSLRPNLGAFHCSSGIVVCTKWHYDQVDVSKYPPTSFPYGAAQSRVHLPQVSTCPSSSEVILDAQIVLIIVAGTVMIVAKALHHVLVEAAHVVHMIVDEAGAHLCSTADLAVRSLYEGVAVAVVVNHAGMGGMRAPAVEKILVGVAEAKLDVY